jgi:hypothetical protein
MKRKSLLFFFILPLLCFFFGGFKLLGPIKGSVVKLKKEKSGYVLYRNSEPYYIRGAGGYQYYETLQQCGGNSVRLWSTDNAQQFLDKAQSLGLTVTLGLSLGQERTGFDYNDSKAVKKQFEEVKKQVLQYKDHPALLMWGVGNEVDQFAKNYKVWDAVRDIVKYIHEVDPDHPTTTMLAGVPPRHIKEIVKRCPELDLLSINAFKWIQPVRKDITDAGWKGPYLIGEWGASGYWEAEQVPWGTFIEETSTQKAQVCAERYKTGITDNKDRCVGSYIYFWGWKQARTHTLLSLFSESGHETAVLDFLHKEWKGKERSNRSPAIWPIGIDDKVVSKAVYFEPASSHSAYIDSKDPDGDKLYYSWEIYPESTEKKEGGDTESKPKLLLGLFQDGKQRTLSFKVPQKEGAYRLFVTVYDDHNHMATANLPFYVKK